MSPSTLRLLFNLYPPYWGTGIRVREISKDYRRVVVEMPLRFYNRKPGKGRVRAEFCIDQALIDEIRAATKAGGRPGRNHLTGISQQKEMPTLARDAGISPPGPFPCVPVCLCSGCAEKVPFPPAPSYEAPCAGDDFMLTA